LDQGLVQMFSNVQIADLSYWLSNWLC